MINSVKTDRGLLYRIYHEDGELMGRTFHIEDAAALVGLYGTGATIKCCQRTVWTQGIDGDASDSFDEVAYAAKVRTHADKPGDDEPDIEMYPGGAAHRDVMGYNDDAPDPPEPGEHDDRGDTEKMADGLRRLGKSADAAGMSVKDFSKPTAGYVIDKDDAFDLSRATNLYLLAARELGTCLGGNSITDLLADRTKWDLVKCKYMGDRIVNDPVIIALLKDEGVPVAYE